MNRSFQSRLSRFHDNLRRKLIDNSISLTGQATDTIRITLTTTKTGDIQTRVVESTDVVPITFPPLVDVPFRALTKGNGSAPDDENVVQNSATTNIQLHTLDNASELFPIEVMSTQVDKLSIGDLLFRVMNTNLDYVEKPLVLCLQIVDQKGTFGVSNLVYAKYECVFYNEELPQEVTDYIVSLAERRNMLRW